MITITKILIVINRVFLPCKLSDSLVHERVNKLDICRKLWVSFKIKVNVKNSIGAFFWWRKLELQKIFEMVNKHIF